MSKMKFENWLEDSADAPAAIVLREYLSPVEGKDAVYFCSGRKCQRVSRWLQH
jgi:hypothetical protein